jgi:diguanylate cyclase (GGDEF)-like protein/PAS domain S-box-containing protein
VGWNRGAQNIFGYTESEILNQPLTRLIPERYRAQSLAGMARIGADAQARLIGKSVELHGLRKNGCEFPLELSLAKWETAEGWFATGIIRDNTERKKSEEDIQRLAFSDPLTGLPNRRLLMDRLEQALASALRHNHQNALLFIDMDDFKTLNDSLGHDKGDQMLQQIAQRLLTCVREGDTVARLGGDEFVVVLENLDVRAHEAAMQAEVVANKIHYALRQTYQLNNHSYHSSASIGITLLGGTQRETIEEPLKRAELAMYKAKAIGRDNLRFFEPEMRNAINTRARLEADLHEALSQQQLLLYYQVQVDAEARPTGVEALLRWQHPMRGLISPAEFIPVAEASGLILPLGHWVLETACKQLATWAQRPEMAHLTISVNVSARQFRWPDFVESVLSVLEATGAKPELLKLELTESLLLDNMQDVIAKMNTLKARGVGFSLDDFGTGYSSLAYLKRLPLDELKIDQGFVRDILTDPNDAAIAKMVIVLAESMGLSVIAEGVETQAQREALAALGCSNYQGYWFGRPVPIEEFDANAARA